jgi:anti-sigma-K factor RskA
MSDELGPTSDDLTAAEYVIGTLPATERVRVERLRATDQALDGAIREWEERLAPLAASVPPLEPSAHVLSRIEAGIRDGSRAGPAEPDRQAMLRRSLRRWRAVAVTSAALAASLALVLAGTLLSRPVRDEYVAVVNRGGEAPALLVTVDMKAGEVRVRSVSTGAPPANHSHELWFVPDGEAPRSLGVLDGSVNRPLPAAPRQQLQAGIIAVSSSRAEALGPAHPQALSSIVGASCATDRAQLQDTSTTYTAHEKSRPTKRSGPAVEKTDPVSDQGIWTLSITWITPFDCITLATVMRATPPLLSAT